MTATTHTDKQDQLETLPALVPTTRLCAAPRDAAYQHLLATSEASELRAAIAKLEEACEPALKTEVRNLAALLIGAYPKREANDPDIYVRSLVYDLQEFPRDIIEQAVHKVRRTIKFLPSCAEVYQAADLLMSERRATLAEQRRRLADHERDEAFKRETEERELKERQERERFLAKLRETFGDNAPTPEDMENALYAFGKKHDERKEFHRAYWALEPWAIALCIRMTAERRERQQRREQAFKERAAAYRRKHGLSSERAE